MIALHLTTRETYSILNLDHIVGIEYDEKSGELTFVGENSARPVYLDKGTEAKKVWDAIQMSFSPVYEPRSLQTHGTHLRLDLTPFQSEEKAVF